MSILSLFKSARVVPEWEFSAGTFIWRMLLTDRRSLVAECRDPEKKVASYCCIELATGNVLWKELKLDEPWWVGIEAVQKDVILLHEFAKPDMPEHKGIRAIDESTGARLWRNDDVAYWFGYGDRVVAYRDFFERRVGYELDLHSGSLIKMHDSSLEELHELRRQAANVEASPDAVFPEIFVDEGSDTVIAGLIGKETRGKELLGRIESTVKDDTLVFNYHVVKRDRSGSARLENNLVMFRVSEKRRMFADVIGRNLPGYVPDSFFIKRPFVLFVKDRTVLTAVRLWKP